VVHFGRELTIGSVASGRRLLGQVAGAPPPLPLADRHAGRAYQGLDGLGRVMCAAAYSSI